MITTMVIVALCLIVILLAGLAYHFRSLHNKRKEREATARKHQQRFDRQTNLGNRIYNALVEACSLNPSGRMRVERMKDNGGNTYTISVGWQEDSSYTMGGMTYRGYPVLEVHIKIVGRTNNQINVAWGPYPSEKNNTYYDMNVERFESGPELQIMAARMTAYSPYKTA